MRAGGGALRLPVDELAIRTGAGDTSPHSVSWNAFAGGGPPGEPRSTRPATVYDDDTAERIGGVEALRYLNPRQKSGGRTIILAHKVLSVDDIADMTEVNGSEPEPKQVKHGNQVIADRLCRLPC